MGTVTNSYVRCLPMIRVPWLNLGQALAVAGAANWPRCFRSTRPPSGKVVRQQFACGASAACTSSLIDGPCQDLVCGPCGLHMTVATLLSPNWEVRQPTRSSGIFSSLVLWDLPPCGDGARVVPLVGAPASGIAITIVIGFHCYTDGSG